MLNLYNVNKHVASPNGSVKASSEEAQKSGEQKNKKIDFTKYVDPTNEISSKELKMGLWYVQHRVKIYRALVGGLIAVGAVFWIYSLVRWVIFGADTWQNKVVGAYAPVFENYDIMNPRFAAQPLLINGTQYFASRENKYDLLAFLTNPNKRMMAKLTYHFEVNGTSTPSQESILLPAEDRFAVYLGFNSAPYESPAVVIDNIYWQRISAHAVPDVEQWQFYRLDFSITDFIFLKSLNLTEANADAIQFKLTNNSPYSYREPRFYVGLFSGEEMVGVMPLRFDSFNSLETKNVDLRSLAPNLLVSDVKVYPLINVYDEEAYYIPK